MDQKKKILKKNFEFKFVIISLLFIYKTLFKVRELILKRKLFIFILLPNKEKKQLPFANCRSKEEECIFFSSPSFPQFPPLSPVSPQKFPRTQVMYT